MVARTASETSPAMINASNRNSRVTTRQQRQADIDPRSYRLIDKPPTPLMAVLKYVLVDRVQVVEGELQKSQANPDELDRPLKEKIVKIGKCQTQQQKIQAGGAYYKNRFVEKKELSPLSLSLYLK